MPAVPRIRRATFDRDEVFITDRPIPVIAALRWYAGKHWGEPKDTEAIAIAWTPSAVQIEWTYNDVVFTDWIDAADVRRR